MEKKKQNKSSMPQSTQAKSKVRKKVATPTKRNDRSTAVCVRGDSVPQDGGPAGYRYRNSLYGGWGNPLPSDMAGQDDGRPLRRRINERPPLLREIWRRGRRIVTFPRLWLAKWYLKKQSTFSTWSIKVMVDYVTDFHYDQNR